MSEKKIIVHYPICKPNSLNNVSRPNFMSRRVPIYIYFLRRVVTTSFLAQIIPKVKNDLIFT